jgi:hypothetical protein
VIVSRRPTGTFCQHLLVSRLLACDSNRLGDVIQAANTLLLSLLSPSKIENHRNEENSLCVRHAGDVVRKKKKTKKTKKAAESAMLFNKAADASAGVWRR